MVTPKFDFDKSYNLLLEEVGKAHVVYLNGIRTTEQKFKENLNGFNDIWSLYGNEWSPQDTAYRGAIELDDQYRNTTDGTGNDWADIAIFVTKFLFNYALEQIGLEGIVKKALKHNKLKKELQKLIKDNADPEIIKDVAKQIDDLQDIADFFDTIKSGIELAESFIQLDGLEDLVKDDEFTAKALLFLQKVSSHIPILKNIS
ncbi:MAG: hypothetical protein F6J92_41735, partial [Symploca sp. SIO1A3]|nr:hypothetical protein [Symploca sp. SIO1A3]